MRRERAARLSATLILAALAASASLVRAEGVEDAERAREAVREGRFVSLDSILDWLEKRYVGTAIKVELETQEADGDPPSYEIEWLTPQNHVIEFKFDARTGELLETEGAGLEEARRQ